jgi:ubiquinone/menaquinone biosynthesis C-methylase UbiE
MSSEKIGFKQSRKSPRDYFAWRVNRAVPAVERVQLRIDLYGKKVLDIGCGYGALSSVLLKEGAQVTGIEVDRKKLAIAKDFFKDAENIELFAVDDEKLPFKDNTFDAVFLFDVIEHIRRPDITIKECRRVLKPDGIIYIEFTPYYSITGHHLYDFAKWPIHILPRGWIKDIVYSKKIKGFLTADDYWQQFESLNKLRISRFQKMMRSFQLLEERFIIKYPEVFELNVPLLNVLGPFKDTFTMSFEGTYKNTK